MDKVALSINVGANKAEWQREVAVTKKAWQPTQETNTVLEGAWERQSSSLSPS